MTEMKFTVPEEICVPSEKDKYEELRKFVDSAAVYIYVVDRASDEILMVNEYYAAHLGVSKERMEGHKCWEFVNPDDGRCMNCPRYKAVSEISGLLASTYSVEAYNPTLGIWGKYTSQEIQWIDGRNVDIITMVDISDEKLLREELSYLAYYDKQMGLPNRAKLEKDIKARPTGNYCLISFDYISLRYINDAYGRRAGDALLVEVIEWIKSFHLQHFETYRLDGDSFCLLFDNADMMSASGLADRIFERFKEPWEVHADNDTTYISSRVSLCVIDGRTGFKNPEELLSVVERTLQISKERESVVVYNAEMDEILRRALEMEISLKNAVMNDMNGFEVHLQPITDVKIGVWKGVEALCRWESPEFGRVPPLVFIRIAEQIGLINTIGAWVLKESIRICSELELHKVEGFFLDVNLSPVQMSDEMLVSNVLMTLNQYNFPAYNLALEITESEEMEQSDYSRTTIERLRALDIRMALDDFGTGYSNFNNLVGLPVSILKTEKQFIDDIADNEYQQFLSRMVVELAHKAGMKLIAEGVEDVAQMNELLKNEADYFQGYLFSEPLNEKDLAANIKNFSEPNPLLADVIKQNE
jgi:diguanylate cyclase (GGDEF)-like protein/PAS domain S-box-containing protein